MAKDEHHLYRAFDQSGALLYVGVSVSALERLRAHRRQSGWFGDLATLTVQAFPDRFALEQAEREAIRDERPLWNVQHNRAFAEQCDQQQAAPLSFSSRLKGRCFLTVEGGAIARQGHIVDVIAIGKAYVAEVEYFSWVTGAATSREMIEVVRLTGAHGAFRYIWFDNHDERNAFADAHPWPTKVAA